MQAQLKSMKVNNRAMMTSPGWRLITQPCKWTRCHYQLIEIDWCNETLSGVKLSQQLTRTTKDFGSKHGFYLTPFFILHTVLCEQILDQTQTKSREIPSSHVICRQSVEPWPQRWKAFNSPSACWSLNHINVRLSRDYLDRGVLAISGPVIKWPWKCQSSIPFLRRVAICQPQVIIGCP